MFAELTIEHKAIAIALAEFLREEGYILSPDERKELERYRKNDDIYVSGKKAAELIGCSPARVIELRKRGLLKHKYEGSVPRYSVKSIQTYNNSRLVRG